MAYPFENLEKLGKPNTISYDSLLHPDRGRF